MISGLAMAARTADKARVVASGVVGKVDYNCSMDRQLFAFIGATQVKAWDQLLARGYGNDADAAQKGFAKRLASEIDSRGTVDVLRHGVIDYGITIQLAFFKPAHGLTPDLQLKYEANRVTVTRQLKYETGSEKSLDLALLVNGI
ncbi:MAG: DUF5069 domain-containing protein, partial [Proteobacteria bacterium]|nr:DUF5069 domain-containing protein [Pseudomonadota bacterium]